MSNPQDDGGDERSGSWLSDAWRRARSLWPVGPALILALVIGAIWDGPSKGIDIYVVRDGDTLELTPRDCALSRIGLSCLKQNLRLYGVDAFERAQTCRDAERKSWPCGDVATQRLAALAARPNFACNVDSEFIDRRAREFAVCTVDGKDVGGLLVSEGLAFYYGRGLQYLPIEAEARRTKRGAWAGSFVRPQFWRQGARS
jgi:endonuclease YncB( thermonuclease family)